MTINIRKFHQWNLSYPTIVLMLFVAMLFGCGKNQPNESDSDFQKKPEVYTNMMDDPVFFGVVTNHIAEQKSLAKERNAIAARLIEMEISVRSILPPDSDAATVRAELDSHPEKYPEWKTLYAQVESSIAAHEANVAELRELTRQRILQEVRDREAVSAGTARAKVIARKPHQDADQMDDIGLEINPSVTK